MANVKHTYLMNMEQLLTLGILERNSLCLEEIAKRRYASNKDLIEFLIGELGQRRNHNHVQSQPNKHHAHLSCFDKINKENIASASNWTATFESDCHKCGRKINIGEQIKTFSLKEGGTL